MVITDADKVARYDAIVAVLQDEHGEWRELDSCADAIDAISGIIEPDDGEITTFVPPVLPPQICETCGVVYTAGRAHECRVPDRWPHASAAFKAEAPWCGWMLAFGHGSDWDTTCFGLKALVGLNMLLTTADGRSRCVCLIEWQHIDAEYLAADDPNRDCERKAGIIVAAFDGDQHCGPEPDAPRDFVPYEDIREVVVY